MSGVTDGTTPAPAGHDAAMAAKSDANDAAALAAAPAPPAAAPPPAPAVRPDNVPEKFWDAKTGTVNTEALLKSYSELEKGKPAAPAPAPAPGAPAPAPAPADDQAAAKAAVGADLFDSASAEFAASGTLKDETYAALAAKGISKDLVDNYIAGQIALASSTEAKAFSLVGGQEQYGAMTAWAASGLTASEIDAYDAAVAQGGAPMEQAILALRTRYEAANGSPQEGMLRGGHTNLVQGYQSEAQMTADMRDKRYASDPAYRQQVEAKLAVTTAF